MKLIYLTAKQYPGGTADHHYILNLARAFRAELGDGFTFVAVNTKKEDLADLPFVNATVPSFLKRSAFFFFWIPLFWRNYVHCARYGINANQYPEDIYFFSNDLNLLSILIFWKRLFGLRFKVVSDWHLLTKSFKDKYVARRSDRLISTSKKLRNALVRISPHADVKTVYGGVSMENFERICGGDTGKYRNMPSEKQLLRKKLGLPESKFLVGYVGLYRTMGQEKGILTMIDSLEKLDKDVMMVFVGGKSAEITEYREYARTKGTQERCLFVPVQPEFKLAEYEICMDVLAIPYPDRPHFRDYGFPMKVYEYMASGVPIIYSKLELVEEVIGDCAYGFEPDNSIDFARVVKNILKDPKGASLMSGKAREKVMHYTWTQKAKTIINLFDIMTPMLSVPDNALKYILFQRTEFSIYQSSGWLIRLVMNKKFPIYNAAIGLEAAVLKNRTKKHFSDDMRREYEILKDHLPLSASNILDIGCGVAGIDAMLNNHYAGAFRGNSVPVPPSIYLLDKSEINPKVYYGLEKEAAYYNSLDIAKRLLVANGVHESRIHLQEATGQPIFPGVKFDLVVSLISWGFHYPVETYLDEVHSLLAPGGKLIMDVRKGSGGEELLKEKFGGMKVIYEARKFRRVAVVKRTAAN